MTILCKSVNTPSSTAIPTPTPTQFTSIPAPVFKIVQSKGAAVGSTPDPAALSTPIAGSAKVAKAPNTKPNARLAGKHGIPAIFFFLGKVDPSDSPRGISPRRRPSIKKSKTDDYNYYTYSNHE